MCFTPRDGVNINFDWQVCTKCQWLAKNTLGKYASAERWFLTGVALSGEVPSAGTPMLLQHPFSGDGDLDLQLFFYRA